MGVKRVENTEKPQVKNLTGFENLQGLLSAVSADSRKSS